MLFTDRRPRTSIGAATAIEIPSPEEIEEARLARLREEEEAKQREIAARIKALEEAHWPALCAEVSRRNLIPGEWQMWIGRVSDNTRVYQLRQYFLGRAPHLVGYGRR